MIRKILGVIAGYTIFVISSVAFFQLTGQKPHAAATTTFVLLTGIYGALFSFIAGFVAALVAKASNLKVNFILAFVIAGFAAFSFFKASGTHWTQLLAIFIFAPVSIAGGLFYNKRNRLNKQ